MPTTTAAPDSSHSTIGNVVHLPVDAAHVAEERLSGRFEVDDWGRDDGAVKVGGLLAGVRWSMSVGGIEHLPHRTGALVVTNSRRLALTPIMVAWALGAESGRPVRFVGRPDVAPVGALMRRVGGLLADPNEVSGALRAHQIVVVGTDAVRQSRRAGHVDPRYVAAALREGVPVLPAAAVSAPTGRRARIEVAGPVRSRKRRRGPLAEVELAEHVQRRLQDLLDEMGGAPVLDWIGET
jgi:1-acyl-sn-glycerol-3-phosphate acyltransferase